MAMNLATTTPTAAQVGLLNGRFGTATSAAVITRGDWIYLDWSDAGHAKLANSSSLLTSSVVGVALNDAQPTDIVRYALPGSEVDPGFEVNQGETYVLADTDGRAAIIAEACGEGAVKVILGFGQDGNRLRIYIDNSAVTFSSKDVGDLTVSTSFVSWISGVGPLRGKAGETITAGQWLFYDYDDEKRVKLADANVHAKSQVIGMALGGASSGENVWFAPPGAEVGIGVDISGVPIGDSIYLSDTSGSGRTAAALPITNPTFNKIVYLGTTSQYSTMWIRAINTGRDLNVYHIADSGKITGELDLTTQDATMRGIDFHRGDGTKMFACGDTNNKLYEYDLSTAWDANSGSYSQDFSVSSETTTPFCVRLGDSGTKAYVASQGDETVYQYTLGTAYDLSTASYATKSYDTSAEVTALGLYGIHLSEDGTKLYALDNSGDDIYQYTLGTAWDISTASYDTKTLDVSSQDTSATGLFFKVDGSMFWLCGTTNNKIYGYYMTTVWDISTATYISEGSVTDPQDVAVKPNGERWYSLDGTGDDIEQYTISN